MLVLQSQQSPFYLYRSVSHQDMFLGQVSLGSSIEPCTIMFRCIGSKQSVEGALDIVT